MKTPTPDVSAAKAEEVKDRVAKKHGYIDFKDMFHYYAAEGYSKRDSFISIITEAMQEYHKGMLEQSGSELPTRDHFIKWMKDTMYSYEDSPHEIFEWMKEQASVVIAKLEQKIKNIKAAQDIIDKMNKGILASKNEELLKMETAISMYPTVLTEQIEEITKLKKEIEELKSSVQKVYDEIWKTQIYPMETKSKPKGDDILKKHFPFIKP